MNLMKRDDIEYTDTQIRDVLLEHNVIFSERLEKCGKQTNRTRTEKTYIYRCNQYECRVCRRRKLERIHYKNIKRNGEFRDSGGEHLLLTFTIPRKPKQKIQTVKNNFTTAMSKMKKGSAWKTIKRDTNCQYHYYKWEIPEGNPNHLHCHLAYAVLDNPITIKELWFRLFAVWERFVDKYVGGKLSKNSGLVISPPEHKDQEIDNYLYKDGRLEELEYLSAKKKIEGLSGGEEFDAEIQELNSCFKDTIRQRIYNNTQTKELND